MSSVQAYANRVAWRDRADNGREKRAGDSWALARIRRRFLSLDQWRAVCRFVTLLERAHGHSRGAKSEYLEGGDADWHCQAWDQAMSAKSAIAAADVVKRSVSVDDFYLFLRAFDTPHNTLQDVCGGDRSHPRFARRIMPSIDALLSYFDGIDNDRAVWKKMT